MSDQANRFGPDRGPALVTGGAKRIGRAIATELAREGYDVAVHYRTSRAEAEDTVQRLAKHDVQAATVQADLTDPDERATLLDEAETALGETPAVLVNNASRYAETTFAEIERANLDEMMELHAWAPLALARELADRSDEAAIVNLLDTRVTSHDPEHVPYILSKKTLQDVTETLAIELAPDTRVNAVAPGAILLPAGDPDADLSGIVDRTPLDRTGTPAEVARAVTYLVEAEFVTGQTVFVDGGRHIR